jgi:hypothetical protein
MPGSSLPGPRLLCYGRVSAVLPFLRAKRTAPNAHPNAVFGEAKDLSGLRERESLFLVAFVVASRSVFPQRTSPCSLPAGLSLQRQRQGREVGL